MDYKQVMDLWFVWFAGIYVIYRYLKSVKDGWNDVD